MSCGVGRRHSLDSVSLWLWHRLAAAAPIRPLAWEPPYAVSEAFKRQKTKKKKKELHTKRSSGPNSHTSKVYQTLKEDLMSRKDTCTPIFTATLFTKAKTCKQTKQPLVEEWIKKIWSIYTVEHYSAMKRMKYCHLKPHGWTERWSY